MFTWPTPLKYPESKPSTPLTPLKCPESMSKYTEAIAEVYLDMDEVVNFTLHFIVIQIFQIFFLPPVSSYTHPNISNIFVGDEINLFNLIFS